MSTGNKTYKAWIEELEPEWCKMILPLLSEADLARSTTMPYHILQYVRLAELPKKVQYTLSEILHHHFVYKKKAPVDATQGTGV